jgi:serine/threonine-protein kinase SRK2
MATPIPQFFFEKTNTVAMQRITMSEIKSHPWFLKNLPRELKEEAQAAYYIRRGGEVAGGATSTSNANVFSSLQSVEEIMRIVQEAQTVPRQPRPVSDYDDEEQQQPDDEDDYDRTVRQVHASGDFLDITRLQI